MKSVTANIMVSWNMSPKVNSWVSIDKQPFVGYGLRPKTLAAASQGVQIGGG